VPDKATTLEEGYATASLLNEQKRGEVNLNKGDVDDD